MFKKITEDLSVTEFVVLMALMMSFVALSIDAMLPALPAIAFDLNVVGSNDIQYVISALFLGLTLGNVISGVMSDSFGRKPVIYAGILIFVTGCIVSIQAESLSIMIIGRVFQGLGASAPKTVSVAIIRDQYSGADMAKIMSFIMTVFIFIPALAPSIGQAILVFSTWHYIFGLLLLLAFINFFWFAFRQRETLAKDSRSSFSVKSFLKGLAGIVSSKPAMAYSLSSGLIFGAFLGYLLSSQQIFQDYYGVGEAFPLYFGGLALAVGVATFANAKFVARFGMYYLSMRALVAMSFLSFLFLSFLFINDGDASIISFMIYLLPLFFCVGILFGNLNSMTMEPLGHIAGLASAVLGSVQSFISLGLGSYIGQLYSNSVVPVVAGFFILSFLSMLLVFKGKRFSY